MAINTTETGAARAMSSAEIDRAFAGAAGALQTAPRRRVKIPLSKSGDEVAEVGFNGRMFLIRRGETVELPAPLIEIIERAGLI